MGKPIKVLMFGWEFPPFNSGGLGTACLGLTRMLAAENVEVIFVLPKKLNISSSFSRITFADRYLAGVTVTTINSLLKPYVSSAGYKKLRKGEPEMYGLTLLEEVKLYALRAAEIAREEDFDIIHAHDWLSFAAGIAAKQVSCKPLVAHVHATEFDRTGGTGVNPEVFEMEREGMQEADAVITVSEFTKRTVVDRYGILPKKIFVAHNGIDFETDVLSKGSGACRLAALKSSGKKIVLFVGRLTLQKGPDYFLRAARRVTDRFSDVYFVVAGSGDMEWQIVREAARLGISDKVIFTGFLRGKELDELYSAADLYVMTSVSEPFGLTALEAIASGTPVILSKQSGVSEVVKSAIKVDFWDIDAIADAIIGILTHGSLHKTMSDNAAQEILAVSWRRTAGQCIDVYKRLLPSVG